MLPNLIAIQSKFNQKINNCFDSNWGILKLTLIIFACFSFIYFPEIIYKRTSGAWLSQDHTIQNFVNAKIQNPFKAFNNLHVGDHLRKRELRITPYLLGKVLRVEAIKLFYLQALLLFPIFIFICLKTITELSKDRIISFWATLTLLGTYVGNSFTYDTFFYDSYAFLGLIAAFFFRKNWILIPILLLTYFVDERSVIPSAAIIIIDKLDNTKGYMKSIINNRTFGYLALAIFLYILSRIILYLNFNLFTPAGKGSGIILFTAFRFGLKIPGAVFSALKLNYLLIFLAISQFFKTKKWLFAFIYISIFSLIIIISFAVEDVTRSLAYGFPLILIFYQLLSKNSTQKENNRLFVMVIAVINLLLPTYTLLLKLYHVPIFNWINLF
jgi:hypothetical protein